MINDQQLHHFHSTWLFFHSVGAVPTIPLCNLFIIQLIDVCLFLLKKKKKQNSNTRWLNYFENQKIKRPLSWRIKITTQDIPEIIYWLRLLRICRAKLRVTFMQVFFPSVLPTCKDLRGFVTNFSFSIVFSILLFIFLIFFVFHGLFYYSVIVSIIFYNYCVQIGHWGKILFSSPKSHYPNS